MIKIEWEQYDSAEQGVTYLATYADRPYSCVLPVTDLDVAGEAVIQEEFRRRWADIERATEITLRRQTEAGRGLSTDLVVVRLPGKLVRQERGVAILRFP